MSEQWGMTGRVWLQQRSADSSIDIFITRPKGAKWCGVILPDSLGHRTWVAGAEPATGGHWVGDLPTRDAAVMWVLRWAAPKVWRAERIPRSPRAEERSR